jgi:hypothetical protein
MPKARTPGLWMVGSSDRERVLDAKKELLSLLDDPYYFEAYQSLLSEKQGEEVKKHPKLLGIKGRRSREVGALARKLQDGLLDPDTEKRDGPGRPRDPLTTNIAQIRAGLEKLPGSLKSNCRAFIKVALGTDSKYATDWLYSKVRSNRRNAS